MKRELLLLVTVLSLVFAVHPLHAQATAPAAQSAAPASVMLDPRVGDNIRMGPDPVQLPAGNHAQAEPHIARSWSDPNLIVAMFQEGRYASGGGAVGNGYAVSTDGGLSWMRAPLLNTTVSFGGGPFARATDPVVAFDHLGRVFLNSLAFNLGLSDPPSKVLVHRSDDDGQTFGLPFSAYTDDWPNNFADKNWMTLDTWPGSPHQGRIAVSFDLFGYNAAQARATNVIILNTFSDDGGQSWSPAASLGLTNVDAAQPVFLPDGSLAVLYWAWQGGFGSPRTDERIEVKISPDGGATFEEPPIIIASGVIPHDDPNARDGWYNVSATTDRMAGIIYAAYQARVGGTPRILFTRSIDQGRTWTPPFPVNDTPLNKSVFNPAIGVSPDGQQVSIIFYDKRDAPTSDHVDLYLAESFDGGDTWEPNIRLSDITSDMRLAPFTSRGRMLGDYQGITPALNFEAPAVAAWIDTRTGSPDPFGVRIHRVQGTTFETWRKLRYSAAELADESVSGEMADSEEDGIVNLFEYVHATEPDVPSQHPLVIARSFGAEEHVVVSYERLAVISDLDFSWLGSQNLTDWSEVEPVAERVAIAENPIMERVEARFAVDQGHLFYRLSAEVR